MWFRGLTAIWLLVISILDIRERKVPVWLLGAGGIMAIVMSVYQQMSPFVLVKGVLPGILLLATAFATKKAGYGDGIVLLILGILAGSAVIFPIFAISLFLAAFFSLTLLVFRRAGRNTRIPFLPFVAAGWLITVMF